MSHRAWPAYIPPIAADPHSIGWFEPSTSALGALAHANSGTDNNNNSDLFGTLYAGVVGGAGLGAVVWSSSFATLNGSQPVATLTPQSVDTVKVELVGAGYANWGGWLGLLTLTATVDGVETDAIVVAVAAPPPLNYASLAWGPA